MKMVSNMPSSNSSNSFKEVQKIFTQHMRDPDIHPAPAGIEDRRMKIYRDLIYNNIQNFMANSFPVVRKIMDDADWHKMMREYVSQHQAQTPLFPRMPQEFLKYLNEDKKRTPDAYPYLAELAHYEWIETALSLDEREIDYSIANNKGDLLEGVPVLNPVSMPAVYQWPVHQLSPDNMPDICPEQATFIIVFRKSGYEISFMELNAVSARLIDKINQDEGKTGKVLLEEIAQELQHPEPDVVVAGGVEILQSLLDAEVLLGTKNL